jgi:SAM-dependent methyltransferase
MAAESIDRSPIGCVVREHGSVVSNGGEGSKKGPVVGGPRAHGLIFDQDAGLYDRIRPTYPSVVFDDLAEIAHLLPGSRVLEVGAGTGQATVHLAGRGYAVTALEPGPSLAGEVKKKLGAFPLTNVNVVSFEGWTPPSERFDAVVAATSFHWLGPGIRVKKAANVLRVGGALAILSTHHVAGGTREFFEKVQDCYIRYDPETEPGLTLPPEGDVSIDLTEIEDSVYLGRIDQRAYPWEAIYTAETYEQLLMTYSGHRALEAEPRSALLACIRDLIDRKFGGRITKRYLFQLAVAHRIDPDPVP